MRTRIAIGSFVGLILAACGEDGAGGGGAGPAREAHRAANGAPVAAPDRDAGGGAEVVVDAATAATIQGTVRFEGEPPARRPIALSGNPECAAMHEEPLLSEATIVNENGTLRNVFVWIKSGLPRGRWPEPAEPVTLNQHECTYEPHVFGIRVGQTLRVRNSDPVLHNIHMRSQRNGEWNFGQPQGSGEQEQRFTVPEVVVELTCDVHSWMKSYAAVVPHPFFAVTGEDGAFAIAGLPPGTYTVEAWHERLGRQEQEVTVGASETKDAPFTFAGGS